jgi:hypothetical protein
MARSPWNSTSFKEVSVGVAVMLVAVAGGEFPQCLREQLSLFKPLRFPTTTSRKYSISMGTVIASKLLMYFRRDTALTGLLDSIPVEDPELTSP